MRRIDGVIVVTRLAKRIDGRLWAGTPTRRRSRSGDTSSTCSHATYARIHESWLQLRPSARKRRRQDSEASVSNTLETGGGQFSSYCSSFTLAVDIDKSQKTLFYKATAVAVVTPELRHPLTAHSTQHQTGNAPCSCCADAGGTAAPDKTRRTPPPTQKQWRQPWAPRATSYHLRRVARDARCRPSPGRACSAATSAGPSQEHSPISSSRAALPPVWVGACVEKVETDVATLERALKSLKEAHRARLMVSFDESREAELDREIGASRRNATQLFRACEKTLKRVCDVRRRRGGRLREEGPGERAAERGRAHPGAEHGIPTGAEGQKS